MYIISGFQTESKEESAFCVKKYANMSFFEQKQKYSNLEFQIGIAW